MNVKASNVARWLASLVKNTYPEDKLYLELGPDVEVKGILVCWMANAGARQTALERRANLIIAHESPYYTTPNFDPGCPHPDTWQVNVAIKKFYAENRIAFIQSHRTLDSFCIARLFSEHLGFPLPIVHQGYKGFEFTLVYDLPPITFAELVADLKKRMKLSRVRTSLCKPDKIIRRVGLGWGGVSLSSNLQYMELLLQNRVEVVIGGEVDEYAMEYYRESSMEWIELGHYASEIIGLEKAAQVIAKQFSEIPVTCYYDPGKLTFH